MKKIADLLNYSFNTNMIKELEKKISPVLVINNSSLKPYVELFEYSPENIFQQPLGSLVGFFEIKEYSEESAYIVNFLTSVLKKEYYINPKRPVTESFDSALHKINLALSELVKQNTVKWLGNLHATICVLEKNNIHFSVAGTAKIFLYRNGGFSDISDGLASDYPEPHPLKTFVNVSSGRLEKGDRILITPDDIFHILPLTELKKNFQRMEGNNLVQFFKTALSNQLEMIATIVIEILDAKPISEVKISNSGKKSIAVANVFSEETFTKSRNSKEKIDQQLERPPLVEDEKSDYTDKKTGHIYVQGEIENKEKEYPANIYWDMTKEKMLQTWYAGKNILRRKFSIYKKRIAKKREQHRLEKEQKKRWQLEAEKIRLTEKEKLDRELELQKQAQAVKAKEETEIKRQQELLTEIALQKEQEQQLKELGLEKEIVDIYKEKTKSIKMGFKEKLALAIKNERQFKDTDSNNATNDLLSDKTLTDEIEIKPKPTNKTIVAILAIFTSENKKNITTFFSDFFKSITSVLSGIRQKINSTQTNKTYFFKIVPHFSKIKSLFSAFTFKQKSYVIAALVLVFIFPIFIVHFLNRPQPKTITEITTIPQTPIINVASDKNINLHPNVVSVLSQVDIIANLFIKTGIAVITKDKIITIIDSQEQSYILPSNLGLAKKATYMQDLGLIFVLTDQNKIISFSPISAKFSENNFNLPIDNSVDFIGTYLTYLYVLDSKNNQIYRYPRATGGFGDKKNWLKDTLFFATVSDMTIDENIYLAQADKIIKLFKGSQQSFDLEASKTPVHFDKIFTTIDSSSLYVLDTQNSRIVQYVKTDGTITKQYFDEKLKKGISLAVDETNGIAYISTSSELISVSL